jgi:hypothetical protein
MKLPLKKEELFEKEKIVSARVEERRLNISQEVPWIIQQQKIAKTKGFYNFDKMLDRGKLNIYSSAEKLCKNEDRFKIREIPRSYSKYSNSGQRVISLNKQLPRFSREKMDEYMSVGLNDVFNKSNEYLDSLDALSSKHKSDNIDHLSKYCSKNKLVKMFSQSPQVDISKDSPERNTVNEKVESMLVEPRDRFSITPPKTRHGYVINYKKKPDRFPKGINILNNRVTYFEIKGEIFAY